MDKEKLKEYLEYLSNKNRHAAHSWLHGIRHWERVERFGLLMAGESPEADREVISWFAYIHDSMRQDDGHCIEHGPKAALFVDEIREMFLSGLDDGQIATLKLACRSHTKEKTTDNLTANICMDADRLDLPRCGIRPMSQKMASPLGAELAGVLYAASMSYRHVEDIQPVSYDLLVEHLNRRKK